MNTKAEMRAIALGLALLVSTGFGQAGGVTPIGIQHAGGGTRGYFQIDEAVGLDAGRGPTMRFWLFGNYRNANSASAPQWEPGHEWLRSLPSLLGSGDPAAFVLYQSDWAYAGVIGAPTEPGHTVVEISRFHNEGTPAHYTYYLIAAVGGESYFDFDQVGPPIVRAQPIPVPRPGAGRLSSRSGLMDVTLSFEPPRYYGDSQTPPLIRGVEFYFANDSEPISSSPGSYQRVLAAGSTSVLGVVPIGVGSIDVSVPMPKRASYFTMELVYNDPTADLRSIGVSGHSIPVVSPLVSDTQAPGPATEQEAKLPTPAKEGETAAAAQDGPSQPETAEAERVPVASERARTREASAAIPEHEPSAAATEVPAAGASGAAMAELLGGGAVPGGSVGSRVELPRDRREHPMATRERGERAVPQPTPADDAPLDAASPDQPMPGPVAGVALADGGVAPGGASRGAEAVGVSEGVARVGLEAGAVGALPVGARAGAVLPSGAAGASGEAGAALGLPGHAGTPGVPDRASELLAARAGSQDGPSGALGVLPGQVESSAAAAAASDAQTTAGATGSDGLAVVSRWLVADVMVVVSILGLGLAVLLGRRA